ncbi:amidase [Dongia sedimenti]|uniref:Amidase n=1 Tax=Dongia sedimenti TaxID=3064282 RepID=A0ABU0YPI4_9PROT|nr:amidase [Rhodospirillaceae bacterium R-7]
MIDQLSSALSSDPARLAATEAVAAIRSGRLTATDLMEACLARIAARESAVRAWCFLDPDRARAAAQLADRRQAAGQPLGPLHGLPVGIKDVFDTGDMPSEYGSMLLRGRQPAVDAPAVAVLRRAGAIVVGKTATSEFGMYHPSPTRNPLDLRRSPGVSSAGSAAAAADHMVPLALGTQHTASTTLPASFCGAFAFKPSFGFTDMGGSNILVPRLAQIGFLARSISDLRLFAGSYDPTLCDEAVSAPPRLALACGPGWSTASADARAALIAFVGGLRRRTAAIELEADFAETVEVTMGLLNVHLSHRFGALPSDAFARLCSPLQGAVTAGRAIGAVRYLELNAIADRYAAALDALFVEHDALIALSAPGEATLLEEGPGSGVMSMLWSLCGLPTVSLPLLHGVSGLPIGVQLIGRHGHDRDLLRAASWVWTSSMKADPPLPHAH